MSEVGVVEYKFKANTADLEKKLKDTDKNVDKTTSESAVKSSAMATVFKAAFAASAAAVVGLGTAAVKSYANYEQLSGGIQTLFKGSADQVMKYANQAYKTAGMSANQYMETVSSFSASLLQGLGGNTEKAAKYANRAVIAMSDNANKMGTSMSAIQYAYQGFAKQNYTMLDNLKLGYGGTASEMARLVNDSGVMGKSFKATAKNINSISFDKIIDAIQVTQDKLGYTGTTAKEASTTIEGSFNSMKAAWENFTTALGGGGDVDKSMQELIETVKTWLGNLIPVVEKIAENFVKIFVSGISSAIGKMRNKLGGWASTVESLTVAISAAAAVFTAWRIAIEIWSTVTKIATAVQAAFNLVFVANPIVGIIMVIAALVAGLTYFFTQTDDGKKVFAEFSKFVTNAFQEIAQFFNGVFSAIGSFFGWIWNGLTGFWNGVVAIWNGIIQFIQQWGLTILAVIFWPISLMVGLFFMFKDQIIGFFKSAWDGVVAIWNVVVGFFTAVWNGIVAVFTPVIQFFNAIFQAAWIGIQMIWNGVVWYYSTLWNGIVAIFSAVAGFFIGVFSAAWNGVKYIFGGVIGFFAGIWNGIVGIFSGIGGAIGGAISGAVKWAINGVLSFAAGMINGFIDAINVAIGIINAIPGVHIGKLGKLGVPRFATGGIVGPDGGGSLIWAGDGGENEWIVPESKMASLVDKINSQTNGTGGGNSYTINVSGVFATDPAEQRKVAELIREQMELADKRRFA